jgi:hypothetical protein
MMQRNPSWEVPVSIGWGMRAAGGSGGSSSGGRMMRVELREILTEEDRRAVLGLQRGPGQDA